ncbi:ccr4 associated factor [Orbilia brochopaga]|uniref:Iron-sulfur cluster assembly factor IBA57 homolog, mitochondrial n=1 Tax=Orbilia brochopaga TaxID=3140254 RepID=A0AAV9UX44_9PEZI
MSCRSALSRRFDYICRSCLQKRSLSTARSLAEAANTPAHSETQRLVLPPSPPAENRTFRLSESRKLIAIQGIDTVKFLNGITTNTLPDAKSVEGLYSGFLTAQGRVLYDVFIYPTNHTRNPALINGSDDPSFLIDVGAALAPELLRHLRRYKLRSKFTMSLIDGFDVWSVPNSFRVGDTTTSSTAASLRIGCVDPRAPGMGRRVVLPSTIDEATARAAAFEDVPTAAADDELAYRLKRYLLGVPEAPGEIISGSALPQESNMDYMSGINFHKGCYLGQELTIRTRHTGVVRKRILPVQLYMGSARPAVGSSAPVYDPSFAPPVPLPTGGNISRVNKKARSAGKFFGSVGNVGLALCRLEIMTSISLGEGPGYDPEVDEFKVDTDAGEGEEVKIKAFVPEWHTTGTITNEVA